MRFERDEVFDREVERYRLRFTCGDCAHRDDGTEGCAHGYPVEEHRDPEARTVVFCKEFSLG